jgi:two-component system, chemotaxis family, chemotaxis protein CheY
MRILIVDDSRAMRSIVRRSITQAGLGEHSFDEAANGSEALDRIREATPGLIIADWNMPQMSGIELLRSLRQQGSPIKLGFVTSEGTDEMKQQAIDAGAAFFLSKPFNDAMLRETLQPHL